MPGVALARAVFAVALRRSREQLVAAALLAPLLGRVKVSGPPVLA
jgi:hypothetical protein